MDASFHGYRGENERYDDRRTRESETVSDQLLNALQTDVVFFDSEGIILRANRQACTDLRTEGNLSGRLITEVIKLIHHDKDILSDLVGELRTGKADAIRLPDDTFIRNKEGGRFFIKGQFVRLSGDEFLLAFRNVVEELTQEYMFKLALSSTKIFPWFYDMERKTMVIDSRYYDYTGIPTKDYTMTLEDFALRLHPDDRPAMAHAFEQQLNGIHYPYAVPFRLLRGDGQWEWFEGQSSYLGQVDGIPYRVVGICMSTQAHKDIEEALISARDKAEQSDRLKSAFLSNMSHEIRTPLNAIVGFSNLLTGCDVSTDSEEAHEYVNLINTNCNQLLTLISDILDLSRIESGTMDYTFSDQSLNQLLSEIYAMHTHSIPSCVGFHLRLPDTDLRLETDPLRLRQVMDNLLSNAQKFTKTGHIDLGYGLTNDGKTVEFFVEDTGCGIPEDQHVKIFERFHKVDHFIQGAGLGLSICKTITECLGGELAVASRLGEGSRFTLRLPVQRPE